MPNAYEKAGVSIAAGEEVVADLQRKMDYTDPHVLGGIGGFAGCYELLGDQLNQPVLVAGADGVGTKVILAGESGNVSGIGQDLVAMCVNDVVAQGALPLFFLDYLAVSKLNKEQVSNVLDGIVAVCQKYKIALLGGETAEMPGVYHENMFDLAGFAVGLASKDDLLTNQQVSNGDVLIGLQSSGLHSNGFSLVRKILFQDHEFNYGEQVLNNGESLIQTLLTPTKIYTDVFRRLLAEKLIVGASHITGGGLLENTPRMLANDQKAVIDLDSWKRLPIFDFLVEQGNLSREDAYLTLNMGIGMVLAVSPEKVERVKEVLAGLEEKFFEIGQVEPRTENEAQVELNGGQHD